MKNWQTGRGVGRCALALLVPLYGFLFSVAPQDIEAQRLDRPQITPPASKVQAPQSETQSQALSGESWYESKAGGAIVGALVGGIIGIAGGLITQLAMALYHRRRLRENLLVGLRGEVSANLDLLRLNLRLRDQAREKRITGSGWFVPPTTLVDHHFKVYGYATSNMGILEPALVGKLTQFNAQIIALNELSEAAKKFASDWDTLFVFQLIERYEEVISKGEDLLAYLEGKRITQPLQADA